MAEKKIKNKLSQDFFFNTIFKKKNDGPDGWFNGGNAMKPAWKVDL